MHDNKHLILNLPVYKKVVENETPNLISDTTTNNPTPIINPIKSDNDNPDIFERLDKWLGFKK
jgi:hypothetical protein